MPIKAAASVPLKVVPSSWTMLDVPQIYQSQTNWCWAACAQMALSHYGNKTVQQCDIAAWIFGQPCCDNPGSESCNEPAQPEDVARIYKHWGRPGKVEYHDQLVSFAVLQREINAKRPVAVGITWDEQHGGDSHQLLVCGWTVDATGARVWVNDPRQGPGQVSYQDLVNAYGWGRWEHTWTGIA